MAFTRLEFLAGIKQLKIQNYKFKLVNGGCKWEKRESDRIIRVGLNFYSNQFQVILQNPSFDISFIELENLANMAYKAYPDYKALNLTFHDAGLFYSYEGVNQTKLLYFEIKSEIDFQDFYIEFEKAINLAVIPWIDKLKSINDIVTFLEGLEFEKMLNYVGSGGTGFIKIPLMYQMTDNPRFAEIRDECYKYVYDGRDLNSSSRIHLEVFKTLFMNE